MTLPETDSRTVPGQAGVLLAEMGDRAVLCDLYDAKGAAVYHDLAAQDGHEVRELVSLVRTAPGPVLDLAAGSGRLTMPLLALGRQVTALELSGSMLELLAARLDEAPAALRDRCTLVRADMSEFSLGRLFQTIVLGTTSVSLLDSAGRKGLYASVRSHLAPGGRFLMSTLEIDPGETGPEERVMEIRTANAGYRLFEHWVPGAETRTVTVFPLAGSTPDETAGAEAGLTTVCTSTSRVLVADQLEEEMGEAGLAVRARHTLPSADPRHVSVLLEVESAA
ncbi:SAM-dependent methyltransferase [Streptomyces sp. CBMA291]|nr:MULTISPECIES: daptide-type RiPP biosynthesis methyltransferase [unclassified Streptomyces]MBD0706881.1 SAM-dependent methyltransferase [Streptomyces sp. CBMA291]MBD0715017.1 SAM-dependent methyltransferase [Streptomyces sp. CBMA370]